MNRAPINLLLLLLALVPAWLACGCGNPPPMMNKYILEYPSPEPVPRAKAASIEDAVKVERFLGAQPFDSSAMVYRPNSFERETYTYNRWRVNPGNMVTDYLTRDLRNSGLFKAVFTAGSAGHSRFLLEGTVEEFQEVDEPDGWKGALALNVTFLDLSEEEVTKKVIFQKSYRAEELLTEKTPRGLAEGISRAMSKVSAQIIADVYRAAKQRTETRGTPKSSKDKV